MGNIKKEELRQIVFVEAHNSENLTDEVLFRIDSFDLFTYRRFLELALKRRELADATGEPGGGTSSVARLRDALDRLEYIISH